MKRLLLKEGAGRVRVMLEAHTLGNDLVVYLYNDQPHLGAVAVADYSAEEKRSSTSMITRLGHKDDTVACAAASTLCKALRRPVCAVAGIHVDRITEEEIAAIVRNCDTLVQRLARRLQA